MENIRVRGKNVPTPIQCWAHAGLRKKFMNVIKREDWEAPTPIQAQAIPAVMSGRDIIGIAKTGSGKTLAFLLPLMRHVESQTKIEEGDGPIGVILTPTRELALQITKDANKFLKPLNKLCVAVYGGTGISEQIGELKKGCEVVVCTPGRMIDMLAVNSGRVINMKRCTMVILDEADRMFDLGFEPQVNHILDQCVRIGRV
jgi:ATP-dependent RNA helicase DDX46/PRP5